MLGITSVNVYAKPQTSVLVTGNELIEPGDRLNYGQVYESNSQMLVSAFSGEGIKSKSQRISDSLEETIETIGNAIETNDLIIITGGISVGDHDHVGTALAELGVKQVFLQSGSETWKTSVLRNKNGKAIFALPGNPAASLTCFYKYVLPVLRKLYGRTDYSLPCFHLPLAPQNSIKPLGRAQFLKAKVHNRLIQILEGQSSAMLNTFALANALVYVEANCEPKSDGNLVEVHLLP